MSESRNGYALHPLRDFLRGEMGKAWKATATSELVEAGFNGLWCGERSHFLVVTSRHSQSFDPVPPIVDVRLSPPFAPSTQRSEG